MKKALGDLYDFLESMKIEQGEEWLIFTDIAIARGVNGRRKKLMVLNMALSGMTQAGMLERRVRKGFDNRISEIKYEESDDTIPQPDFYNWFEYKILPFDA